MADRERLQQVEGLQAHRNALRQISAKLFGLCLPRRCSRMVDLMSLDLVKPSHNFGLAAVMGWSTASGLQLQAAINMRPNAQFKSWSKRVHFLTITIPHFVLKGSRIQDSPKTAGAARCKP
jgi:hypothetical protein